MNVALTVPAAGALGAVTLKLHEVVLDAGTVVAWQFAVTTDCGCPPPRDTVSALMVIALPPVFWKLTAPAT